MEYIKKEVRENYSAADWTLIYPLKKGLALICWKYCLYSLYIYYTIFDKFIKLFRMVFIAVDLKFNYF